MPLRKPRAEQNNLDRARSLRRDMTFPERLVWSRLRNSKLHGLRFRRQERLGAYFADFYCHAAQIVVEIDGASHLKNRDYDRRRTAYLESHGLKVIRFSDDWVLRDLDEVIGFIGYECRLRIETSDMRETLVGSPTPPRRTGAPLPKGGES